MLIIMAAAGGKSWVRELFMRMHTDVVVIDSTTQIWMDEFDEIEAPILVKRADPRDDPKPGTHGDVTGIYQRRRGKKHA